MVARFHYDDAVFERLLQDRLPPDEQQDVTQHVEGCTSCQSKLEVLAEQGICWEDVRNFLKDREQSEITRDSNQANPSSVWIGFLEPSERRDSLGRFGRYEILEVLGRGGTGIVMRGHDPSLNRQCAIKVLSPELAASAAARKRFSREAKSAAAVVHEHVVPIQTVDEEQGLPYLVMPVLEGRSLEDRVRKNGPLDVKEILRVGRQIASGLAAAHAQGLIHRDVKPANILLNHGVERVVITDFGLARAADDASMTQSGTLVGTPQYMSPEQAKGESLDVRSDLFSLGSVLYFMATGHSPFRAENTMGILNRITSDTPRSLTDHNSEIPQWFDQIVRKLLAKRPEDRYATAADIEKLLGDWLAHLQDPARVPRPAEPKTSEGNGRSRIAKWIAASLGGFLLLWAGITVVLETGKGTLIIENQANDVAVRIKTGDKVYDQLTVKKGENKVRLAAGKYVVEIDGEHDGISIENGEVTLTRGERKLVRIVEQMSSDRINSSLNPIQDATGIDHIGTIDQSTSVSMARHLLQGDWYATSQDRAKLDVPIENRPVGIFIDKLNIDARGSKVYWEELRKVNGTPVTRSIRFDAKVDVGTQPNHEARRIVFHKSSGLEIPKTLIGTYRINNDELTITINEAINPPDELGSMPVTWVFRKYQTQRPGTSRSPSTGNSSGSTPDIGIETPLQAEMSDNNGAQVVPIPQSLLSRSDRLRPWLSFTGTNLPVVTEELGQLGGVWHKVTDNQNANSAVSLEIHANRFKLGWRFRKEDGQTYFREMPGTLTLVPDNSELSLTIYRPGYVDPQNSTQRYFVYDRYHGTYSLKEGLLTISLNKSENEKPLAEQEVPITWQFRREPQVQPYVLSDDTQWIVPEHLFPVAPENWKMTEESWKPLPGVAPSEIQDRLTSELQVSMTAPEEVGRGDSIRFTATISNMGEAPINQIEVSAYIGHHLKVIGATGTPDQFPGRVLWKLNQIQPNEDVVLQYTCEQTQPFPQYHSELVITTQGNRKQLMARVRQKDYKYGPGNDSDMRADFSSDLAKLTGQWVEIQDPEQETTIDPLRLSLKNGRYAIPWTAKSDRNIVNLIGGGFTLHTNEPRILFHRSALPIDAPKDRSSVSTLHSFSGSYKFEDEQLLLTIDEVDGSPEFLPKGLPTTYRFRRLSGLSKADPPNAIDSLPGPSKLKVEFKQTEQHVKVGEFFFFRAKVTNASDQTIEKINVHQTIDPKLVVSALTSPADNTEDGVAWSLAKLDPGQSAVLEVQCKANMSPGSSRTSLSATANGHKDVAEASVRIGLEDLDDAAKRERDATWRPLPENVIIGPWHLRWSDSISELSDSMEKLQGVWQDGDRRLSIQGHAFKLESNAGTEDAKIIAGKVRTSLAPFQGLFGEPQDLIQFNQSIETTDNTTKLYFRGSYTVTEDRLDLSLYDHPAVWKFVRVKPSEQNHTASKSVDEPSPSVDPPSTLGEQLQQYQPAPVSPLQGTWNEITGVNIGEQTWHRPLRIQGDQMTISWYVMPPVDESGTYYFGAAHTSVEGKLTLDEKAGSFTYLAQKKASGELAAKKEFIFNFTLKGGFKLADEELTLNIKEAENVPPTLIRQDLPVTLRYRRTGTATETPPKAKPKSEPIKSPLSDYLPLQGKWFEVVDDAEQQATSRYGRKIIDFHREFYTLAQMELNEGINYAMTGPLQLEAGSSEKPVSMKFDRIVKRGSTAYPKNGEPYPIRVTYVEPVFFGRLSNRRGSVEYFDPRNP